MTLLTVQETTALLRISRTSLSRLRDQKKIRAVKVGGRILFDEADLIRFIDASKSPRRVPRI